MAVNLLQNLVSYWKFDEASGDAADSVGSNTLVNANSTAYVAGKMNNGADLERDSNNYFSITDAAQTGLDITGDLSMSIWFKPESNVEAGLMGKFGVNGQRSYLLYKSNDAGGLIHFKITNDGSTEGEGLWTHVATLGTWYHYVVTYDASEHSATLYINGVSQGAQDVTYTSLFNSTADFAIGSAYALTDEQDGIVDEAGIWSRVLTTDDIAALYNSGNGGIFPFVLVVSISESVGTSTESITVVHTHIPTISETAGVPVDTANLRYGYTNQTKNTSTWTNEDKS